MATRAEHSHIEIDLRAEEESDESAPLLDRPQLTVVQPLSGRYLRYFKPVVDRVGGILLTVLTLPLVLLIVPSIWISIGRPAIFRQKRVGRNGRLFTVYKFRTMEHDRRMQAAQWDGPERRVNHKTSEDPRHTFLGRTLRKWSLDEIPQFWNVALGQMSLVGPRPELVEIVRRRYQPWQHQRHLVKPGVTGLWQVSARTNGKPMHDCTDLDIEYVRNVTLLGDLKILLKTVPAALGKALGE